MNDTDRRCVVVLAGAASTTHIRSAHALARRLACGGTQDEELTAAMQVITGPDHLALGAVRVALVQVVARDPDAMVVLLDGQRAPEPRLDAPAVHRAVARALRLLSLYPDPIVLLTAQPPFATDARILPVGLGSGAWSAVGAVAPKGLPGHVEGAGIVVGRAERLGNLLLAHGSVATLERFVEAIGPSLRLLPIDSPPWQPLLHTVEGVA